MLNNTTGSDNVAIGFGALSSNQTSDCTVAIGHMAMQSHTTGDGNVAIGDFALATSTSGNNNVGIGRQTSANNKDSCILLGNYAQTLNSHELALSGINMIGTITPPPRLLDTCQYG